MKRIVHILYYFIFVAGGFAYSQSLPQTSFSINYAVREGTYIATEPSMPHVSHLNIGPLSKLEKKNEVSFTRLWSDTLQSGVYAVAFTHHGALLAGCSFGSKYGLLKSTDQGQTWRAVGPADIMGWALTVNNLGWIYASTFDLSSGHGLFRSIDDGETWEPLTGKMGTGLPDIDWGFDLAISPQGHYFFATNEGMWRSLYSDNAWTSINNGIPPHRYRPSPASVKSPVFLDDKIFIVRSYDVVDSTNGIFMSSDNGDTWNISGSGIPVGTPLKTLAVNNGLIFAGGLHYQQLSGGATILNNIYISRDAGASWQKIADNFCINQLRTDFRGNIYCGMSLSQPVTGGGVFRSTNDGVTWEFLGLPSNDIWSTVFDDSGYIFAGGLGLVGVNNGVHRSITPVVNPDTTTPTEILPLSIELLQNFPNPFNSGTMINYSLSKRRFVTLKIYNMLGQEVAVLVNKIQEEGSYVVPWTASGLASGIYFYSLQVGILTKAKKLLFIK